MQLLYNSDSYVVVQFDVPAAPGQDLGRGGYEIVDKFTRKEIYLEGAVAETFKLGVQALVDGGPPTEEALDDFISGYTTLAQHPVLLH